MNSFFKYVKTLNLKIETYNLKFGHIKRLKKGPEHYSIQSLLRPYLSVTVIICSFWE